MPRQKWSVASVGVKVIETCNASNYGAPEQLFSGRLCHCA
nr:MAG TPA: hypothetical protein [Caudoviricetes sp.]